MPRLGKFDLGSLSSPALNDKIVEFAEREAKELANIGIEMLGEWTRRRLSRPRPSRTSTPPQQDWNGRAHASDAHPPAGPYQVLGLAPDASDDDVEKAFRRKVLACHPDRTGGNDEEVRKVIEAIHQIREERKTR